MFYVILYDFTAQLCFITPNEEVPALRINNICTNKVRLNCTNNTRLRYIIINANLSTDARRKVKSTDQWYADLNQLNIPMSNVYLFKF